MRLRARICGPSEERLKMGGTFGPVANNESSDGPIALHAAFYRASVPFNGATESNIQSPCCISCLRW